jgi:DNA-directed RNA polymerase subunit RPC12/RpoP
MIKVIDSKPDPSVVKEIICKNCGSKLEYTPIDLHVYHGTDYSGGPDGEEWINCPSCAKKVTVRSW